MKVGVRQIPGLYTNGVSKLPSLPYIMSEWCDTWSNIPVSGHRHGVIGRLYEHVVCRVYGVKLQL